MNKFFGIGRLVRDLELRQTNSGRVCLQNTIAIKNDYKNANDEYGTEFVNIQAWGKTAEYLNNYATKGMKVAVEGRLTTRDYDKADGTKGYVTEVVCNSVELLEKRSEQVAEETIEVIDDEEPAIIDIEDIDLQF